MIDLLDIETCVVERCRVNVFVFQKIEIYVNRPIVIDLYLLYACLRRSLQFMLSEKTKPMYPYFTNPNTLVFIGGALQTSASVIFLKKLLDMHHAILVKNIRLF